MLIFLASEARADQQGFDEFVARANATQFTDAQLNRMILGKQYDCELKAVDRVNNTLDSLAPHGATHYEVEQKGIFRKAGYMRQIKKVFGTSGVSGKNVGLRMAK